MLPNQRVIIEFSGEQADEFLSLLRSCKSLLSAPKPSITNQTPDEFVDELRARRIIAGRDEATGKPISKPVFNQLRTDKKIKTYYPSPGRTVFKRSELLDYLSSVGQDSLLPSKKFKAIK